MAVISELQQVRKIPVHLIKTGKAPPGLDPAAFPHPSSRQESVRPFAGPNGE
jgi:hypothetical protein